MVNKMRTSSEDIKLSGDFNDNIRSRSGDIKIKGNILGRNVRSRSGDIKIFGFNEGLVDTSSGDVELSANYGRICTISGDVEVDNINGGYIETSSGDMELGANTGKLKTDSGSISIGNIKIKPERFSNNISNVSRIFGERTGNIISGSNVTIVNGTVINGDIVGGSGDSGKEKYIVHIDNLEVDYLKKKFSINGKEFSVDEINSAGNGKVEVREKVILVDYEGQRIIISENSVEVESI